ncbi:MAG: pitrilysin family protein, partial [Clostridium sp.]|nr:pitrilysin family protein [Clostridium sp.]
TSFCIGFNAGALMEEDNEKGLAHSVEHMIFKGTKKRSEIEINRAFDEIFGFNNAMTNFPYSIYYGTVLSEDFESGFELYTDIIKNPIFNGNGFKEEIDIISEELKEWKDDNFQLCEDEMLKNAFKKRRINTCIIGNEDSLRSFSMEDIKNFYKKFYVPHNCVISVVSSLDFNSAVLIVKKYMENWIGHDINIKPAEYEKNIGGTFIKNKPNIKGAKIQYCFNIDELDEKEIMALAVFNFKFGEGTSSLLYDKIRTQNGLAYDVFSKIKNETGIKLFTICMGCSNENVEKSIKIIDSILKGIINDNYDLNEHDIIKCVKGIKLKERLKMEKSIELSKKLASDYVMYGKSSLLNYESKIDFITAEFIIKTARKVLKRKPTIQILRE